MWEISSRQMSHLSCEKFSSRKILVEKNSRHREDRVRASRIFDLPETSRRRRRPRRSQSANPSSLTELERFRRKFAKAIKRCCPTKGARGVHRKPDSALGTDRKRRVRPAYRDSRASLPRRSRNWIIRRRTRPSQLSYRMCNEILGKSSWQTRLPGPTAITATERPSNCRQRISNSR